MQTCYRTLIVFFLLNLCCFTAAPGLADEEYQSVRTFQPLSSAPAAVNNVFCQVARDFEIYRKFLEAEYSSDGTCYPVNFKTPDQARAFLKGGFTDDLANAICSQYTCWDSSKNRLVLLPQDGLPILTINDQSQITFRHNTPAEIVFTRSYSDCFQPGDRLAYSVTSICRNDVWKISAFSLDLMDGTGSGQ